LNDREGEKDMPKAIVILANGFEEVEAITPADFLQRAGVDVILVGIDGGSIRGSHGIIVEPNTSIESAPNDADCIIIPGGMPGSANIAASEAAIKLIRSRFESGKLVAAICAAPAIVLAKSGIIRGKRVTCYPGYEDKLVDSHWSEARVVVDGNIITSRAAGTAAEFSLAIVEYLVGRTTADKIANSVLLMKC
jgi:4-methyl-5(b-hydroxyethyl)-thiazole monophosphate biosynthesis